MTTFEIYAFVVSPLLLLLAVLAVLWLTHLQDKWEDKRPRSPAE
jgi:hypothetical protein